MTIIKKINRDLILKKSFELVNKIGLKSLSMRKISDSLGIQAMSLYNHVENKEDIIDGIVDLGVQKFLLPDQNKPWKKSLKESYMSMYETLLEYQWLAIPLTSRINIGPAKLVHFERMLHTLHSAGFTLPQADHAINLLDSHVFGFCLIELNFPIKSSEYSDTAKKYISMIPKEQFPAMFKLTKLVAEEKYHGIQEFTFGLDIILTGLEDILIKKPRRRI